jgi:hypothetical protein
MSDMSDVPDGTVQEVLDWVGDDPGRAGAALHVEEIGAGRTTLLTKLGAIASAQPAEEAPVTEDPQPVVDEETGEPIVPPVPDVVLDTTAIDTHVSPVHIAHADVEVPEYDDLTKVEVIESDPVGYFQLAGSPRGAVFSFNGGAYALSATQVASFKAALDTIVSGLTL